MCFPGQFRRLATILYMLMDECQSFSASCRTFDLLSSELVTVVTIFSKEGRTRNADLQAQFLQVATNLKTIAFLIVLC